jgi:glucose/mannose-6-phosphate isomerase
VRDLREDILEEPEALVEADRGGMLRAVATAGAQVRAGWRAAEEAGIATLADEGRPRALVVAGVGGSGQAGDVLAAVAGAAAPLPILVARGPLLPGWVGPLDLVCAVSCSGRTPETIALAAEAARRGCRLIGIGAPGSLLAQTVGAARGLFIPVDAGSRPPRMNLWALSTPLLAAGAAVGLLRLSDEEIQATADLLDADAERCGPLASGAVNPAKALATELVGSLPVVWGSGDAGAAAAVRFGGQLHENAKLPALVGVLPEAGHGQIVALDGPFAGHGGQTDEDFFRDRGDEPELPRLAAARGVGVNTVWAQGATAVERVASLTCVLDFASVYTALASGVDPAPIPAIDELKERVAE